MEGTAAISKSQKDERCWRGFQPGAWTTSIDVRDFITRNATPYSGDEKFLAGPSKRTKAVWEKLQPYFQEERKKGSSPLMRGRRPRFLGTKPDISTRRMRSLSDCKLTSPSSERFFRLAACAWSRLV